MSGSRRVRYLGAAGSSGVPAGHPPPRTCPLPPPGQCSTNGALPLLPPEHPRGQQATFAPHPHFPHACRPRPARPRRRQQPRPSRRRRWWVVAQAGVRRGGVGRACEQQCVGTRAAERAQLLLGQLKLPPAAPASLRARPALAAPGGLTCQRTRQTRPERPPAPPPSRTT